MIDLLCLLRVRWRKDHFQDEIEIARWFAGNAAPLESELSPALRARGNFDFNRAGRGRRFSQCVFFMLIYSFSYVLKRRPRPA